MERKVNYMTTMFIYEGMFESHIKDSKLKMPENFDEYNPEEYPHFHVFMIVHLGRPINVESLEDNANIIAEISDEDIKTVTLEDLLSRGLDVGCGDLI